MPIKYQPVGETRTTEWGTGPAEEEDTRSSGRGGRVTPQFKAFPDTGKKGRIRMIIIAAICVILVIGVGMFVSSAGGPPPPPSKKKADDSWTAPSPRTALRNQKKADKKDNGMDYKEYMHFSKEEKAQISSYHGIKKPVAS
jgi:hypothetical protein